MTGGNRVRPDEGLGPKFMVYHDVVAAAGGDASVAARAFRTHVEAIASAGYRFASLSAFLDGAPLDHRDVILTFDDGARSFVSAVLPALRDVGAVATLFILTGFMGKRGRDVEFFDWDELVGLQADGVEIGSHGMSHVPFDQIEPDRRRAEIYDSAAAFDAHGITARALAYPFGRFDDASKTAVRDAGYEAAFTVMKGGYDRFEIRRRLLTGVEGATATRAVLSDGFFSVREVARSVVPNRFLKQEQPVARERWGLSAFGVDE